MYLVILVPHTHTHKEKSFLPLSLGLGHFWPSHCRLPSRVGRDPRPSPRADNPRAGRRSPALLFPLRMGRASAQLTRRPSPAPTFFLLPPARASAICRQNSTPRPSCSPGLAGHASATRRASLDVRAACRSSFPHLPCTATYLCEPRSDESCAACQAPRGAARRTSRAGMLRTIYRASPSLIPARAALLVFPHSNPTVSVRALCFLRARRHRCCPPW